MMLIIDICISLRYFDQHTLRSSSDTSHLVSVVAYVNGFIEQSGSWTILSGPVIVNSSIDVGSEWGTLTERGTSGSGHNLVAGNKVVVGRTRI